MLGNEEYCAYSKLKDLLYKYLELGTVTIVTLVLLIKLCNFSKRLVQYQSYSPSLGSLEFNVEPYQYFLMNDYSLSNQVN